MKTRKIPENQKHSTLTTFRAVMWSSLVTFGAKLVAELIVAVVSAQVTVHQMPHVILV